jgi:hypothetical protein
LPKKKELQQWSPVGGGVFGEDEIDERFRSMIFLIDNMSLKSESLDLINIMCHMAVKRK